jgi:hypothetical protein
VNDLVNCIADSEFFKIEAPTILGINGISDKRLISKNQQLYEITIKPLNCIRINRCALINKYSLIKYKKCVEKLALYFKREEGYDFIQFCALPKNKDEDNYEAWLFHTISEQVIGSCVFRKINDPIHTDIKWKLDWIWLHPYFRRNGILSGTWDKFMLRYGFFYLEFPLSYAMHKFLLKQDLYLNELEKIYPGIKSGIKSKVE